MVNRTELVHLLVQNKETVLRKKKKHLMWLPFYPCDAAALKHIIVWNCLCVWPELKSILLTSDPEPCSQKTVEAKWEERQSSG